MRPGPPLKPIWWNFCPISLVKNWSAILSCRWAILREIEGAAGAWLFLRALGFGVAVPGLMRLSLVTLDRLLSRRFPGPGTRAPDSGHGRAVVRGVDGALAWGRPLVRSGCLSRGLTRYYFLRRAGFEVTLVFGIPRKDGSFLTEPGHCWLEWAGKPIWEDRDPRMGFVPIYQLPKGEVGEGTPTKKSAVL